MSRIRRESSSVTVALSLAYTVESLLANKSSLKCVVDGDQTLFTNCSAILLQNLDIEHPIGSIINGAVQTHHQKYRSGCNALILLIGYWSKCLGELIDQGIPLHTVVNDLQQGIGLCIDASKRTKLLIKEGVRETGSSMTSSSSQIHTTKPRMKKESTNSSNTEHVFGDNEVSFTEIEFTNVKTDEHSARSYTPSFDEKNTASPLDSIEDVGWFFEGGVDPGPVDIDSEVVEMLHSMSTDPFPLSKVSGQHTFLNSHIRFNETKSQTNQERKPTDQGDTDIEFDSCFNDISPTIDGLQVNTSKNKIQDRTSVIQDEDSDFDSCFDDVEISYTASIKNKKPKDCCDVPAESLNVTSNLLEGDSNANSHNIMYTHSAVCPKETKYVLPLSENDDLKPTSTQKEKESQETNKFVACRHKSKKLQLPLAEGGSLQSPQSQLKADNSQNASVLKLISSDLKDRLSRVPMKTSTTASSLMAKSRHFRTIANAVDDIQSKADSTPLSKVVPQVSEMLPNLQTNDQFSEWSEVSPMESNTHFNGSFKYLSTCGKLNTLAGCQNGEQSSEKRNHKLSTGQVAASISSTEMLQQEKVISDCPSTIKDLGQCLSHGADEVMDMAVECLEMQRNGNKHVPNRFELSRVHSVCVVGAQWSKRHVTQGLVIEVDLDQLPIITRNSTSLHSVLLINGDLTLSHKHMGHRQPQKTIAVTTGQASASCNGNWLRQVESIFTELSITGVLVKGIVEKSLLDHCQTAGIVVLQKVTYKVLQALAEATDAHLLSYPADATQEDVAKEVMIGCLQTEWMNHTSESSVIPRSYAVISSNDCDFQTAVLCHPVRDVVYNQEECFWHCCHRLHSAYQTGELLAGGGSAEKQCLQLLLSTAEKLRTDQPCADLYRPAVYTAMAKGFQQYLDTLQKNLTAQDSSCVSPQSFGRKCDFSNSTGLCIPVLKCQQINCYSDYNIEQRGKRQCDCSKMKHSVMEQSTANITDCTHNYNKCSTLINENSENGEEKYSKFPFIYDVPCTQFATWEIAGQIVRQILLSDYEIVSGIQENYIAQQNILCIL